jgi:peptidoglycan/xylan/chitin deacetylase (PgdA/CDA1 family)
MGHQILRGNPALMSSPAVAFREGAGNLRVPMEWNALFRSLCQLSGMTAFAWRRLPPGLFIFNYHRIGNPATTPFDPAVFSCSEDRFAEHVQLIRSRFEVIGMAELLTMVNDRTTPRCPMAMITFDDGYRDNYTKAFPVLQATGTPAVFFLTSSFVGSSCIAWWDEVVWQARRIPVERLAQIPWLQDRILTQPLPQIARQVLRAFKRSTLPIDEKLAQLRTASGCVVGAGDRSGLFMDWDDVRAMRRAGMGIGSHCHTHPILSHLSPSEQRAELETSKRIIQEELGEDVHALAYPVGGFGAYSADTIEAARSCDYRVAFTFVAGVNERPCQNPFELRRIGVEEDVSSDHFRFVTAQGAMSDSEQRRPPGHQGLRGRLGRIFESAHRGFRVFRGHHG